MNLPTDKQIILFDGVCNLCNSTINYVIDHDKKDLFRFVSLQSDLGHDIQKSIGLSPTDLDSIILYLPADKYFFTKSSAAIKILSQLDGFWFLIKASNILPKSIRNMIYDFIARNRYKWYGKSETCRIPTPELESKFL